MSEIQRNLCLNIKFYSSVHCHPLRVEYEIILKSALKACKNTKKIEQTHYQLRDHTISIRK
jgi:hypothetical protein